MRQLSSRTLVTDRSCESSVQSQSQIREQLLRILASRQFNRSERLGRLLHFIVEAGIRRDVQGLKESVLGREVYDRGSDFDARIDPIVRTEVRRLRRKLAEYYEQDGHSDSLLIAVPKGAYVPTFRFRRDYSHARIAGDEIGPYRIIEKLGEGCNGVTYRVCLNDSGREFALKVLVADLNTSGIIAGSLDSDVQAAAALDHENVSRVHGVERWAGETCIVWDFCEGQNLEDLLYTEQPCWSDCLNIARQLLAGLAGAHAQQVIHGRLKPCNVLLVSDPDGGVRVKILNLGTRALAGRTSLTPDRQTIGNAAYSPQQEGADARSDVWSAGAVLHELFTGHPAALPFAEHRDHIPWRRDIPTTFRGALADLLSKCLEVQPQGRFEDAVQLQRAFAAVFRGGRFARISRARPRIPIWASVTVLVFIAVAAALLATIR